MVEIGDRIRVHVVGGLDDGRRFLDTRKAGGPLDFVVGSKTMLPAFERALLGMEVGQSLSVSLSPGEAYGEYDEALIERIPIQDFPHANMLPVGRYIEIGEPESAIRCKVLPFEDGVVVLDHNHELAGQAVRFDVDLLEIVADSAIERELHPAGCACGCDRLKESLASYEK